MKKLLLVCASIAMTGCGSSTPGDGDIEKFLEPLFASCKNVHVTNVDKTDGYGEKDNYLVEFKYDIEIDGGNLDKLHKAYLADKASRAEEDAASQEYSDRRHALEQERVQLLKDFYANNPRPAREDFAQGGNPAFLSGEQEEAYRAASTEFEAKQTQSVQQKVDEAEALKAAWEANVSARPQKTFKRNVHFEDTMGTFYYQGCAHEVGTFMRGMLAPVNDPEDRFEQHVMKMEGKLRMRKTESGWRAIGGN
jgi:hypothetical protein